MHHAYEGYRAYSGHHAYSGYYSHLGPYEDDVHHDFRTVHGHFNHMNPWTGQGVYWPYPPNDDQNYQDDSDYNKGMKNGQEDHPEEGMQGELGWGDGEGTYTGPVAQEG